MFSEKDTSKLLNLSAELLVTLRSWGFHNVNETNPLCLRNADTGKLIQNQKEPFQELSNLILKLRKQQFKKKVK